MWATTPCNTTPSHITFSSSPWDNSRPPLTPGWWAVMVRGLRFAHPRLHPRYRSARVLRTTPHLCDCPPLTPLCHGSASHASYDMASDKATHISQINLFNPINQRESHSPYFRVIRGLCKRHANVLPYTPTIIHGRYFVVLTNLSKQQFDDLTNLFYFPIRQKFIILSKNCPAAVVNACHFDYF